MNILFYLRSIEATQINIIHNLYFYIFLYQTLVQLSIACDQIAAKLKCNLQVLLILLFTCKRLSKNFKQKKILWPNCLFFFVEKIGTSRLVIN